MPGPFAAALTVLFNAAGSDAAIYTPLAGGSPYPVRVILDGPDRLQPLDRGALIIGTVMVSLMRTQVALPVEGDLVEVIRDGATYRTLQLIGEASADDEDVSWRIGAKDAP